MKRQIFNVLVDDLTEHELDSRLEDFLKSGRVNIIVTPNPEFVLLARKNPFFARLLQNADLSLPDGVGLRFAVSALTDDFLLNRHTGVDLVSRIVRLASMRGARVVFLGGAPKSALAAKHVLSAQIPNADIKLVDPGHVPGDADSVEINREQIEQLKHLDPTILIVALGQGKQERFITSVKDHLPGLRIAVGVGGSFEAIAGIKARAPRFMQQIGLEWVWRFVIEPSRYRRILRAFPGFPIVVVWATLKQRRFLHSLKRTLPEIWRQLRAK